MIDFLATDLSYQILTPTRNQAKYNIPAASPDNYPNRQELMYILSIQIPEYPGSNTYRTLIEIPNREKPPITEGNTTRYEGAYYIFQSLLESILSRKKPTFRQSDITVIPTLCTPYLLTEKVMDGTTVISTTNVPVKYAIKAGFHPTDFELWGGRFFSNYLSNTKQFLTWQENNKRVSPQQEEYLYFLLNFTPVPTTVKLRVKAIYTDASEETFTAKEIVGTQYMQILCVPVGAFLLSFNSEKTLQSYTVWLSDGTNNRISQQRTYYIETQYFSQKREILFSNSFSCFETLSLTGVSTEALQVSRLSAYREKPNYQSPEWNDFYIAYREGTRSLSVSTGFLNRKVAANLRHLNELYLSEETYLITDRNHEPLELISDTIIDHNDNPELVSRELQFRYVRNVTAFSLLPIPPVFASRPTYWKPFDSSYVLDAYGKRTGYVAPVRLVLYYADDDTPVSPYTQKANTPNDPNYVAPTIDPLVVAGYTPYPSVAIDRQSTYQRNTCAVGMVGQKIQIIIPAEKYGGEQPGISDALAEAEYNALNTQANVNSSAQCLYLSAAISRPSTYSRNNCGTNETGATWTIVVPYGAYTSTVSQAEADTLADNYANSLDTQANANINAACVPAWQYTYTPPEGYYHVRIGLSSIPISDIMLYHLSNASGTSNSPIQQQLSWKIKNFTTNNKDVDLPATGSAAGFVNSSVKIEVDMNNALDPVNITVTLYIYKNGTLVSTQTTNMTSSNQWYLGDFPNQNAGDLFYVRIA